MESSGPNGLRQRKQDRTMDNKEIRKILEEMAEPEFQKFASSLIPEMPAEHLIGVRLPKLRRLAKQLAKEDWHGYLRTASDESFEEIMLQGMVIGYAKADIQEIKAWTDHFLPKIDNWSVCDSFCAGLKITKEYPEEMWDYIQGYLTSERTYDIRFAVVMLINYYIDDTHIKQALRSIEKIQNGSYYVKMAAAWAVSMYYVYDPSSTEAFLSDTVLDDFTYNKALQKICESRQVSRETKEKIRAMRRKFP